MSKRHVSMLLLVLPVLGLASVSAQDTARVRGVSQPMKPVANEPVMKRVDDGEMTLVADASDGGPKGADVQSSTKRNAKGAVGAGDRGMTGGRGGHTGAMYPTPSVPAPVGVGKMPGLTQLYFPSGDKSASAVLLERQGPAEVRRGEPYTYEIKITNMTGLTLAEVQLVEHLAEAFELKGTNPDGGSAPNLKWSWDKLSPRETKTVSISGSAKTTGQVESCATVTFRTDICSAVKVVEPVLQLAITLPPEVILCDPIPMTMVVRNSGSGVARNVRITASLPSGLTTDAPLTFAVGDLAAGQMREVSATLKSAMKGSFTATGNAIEDGGLTADASATVAVMKPELAVTKTGPETRYIGRPAKYEITVTNNGDAPANDCVLTDDLPGGTQLLETTAGGSVMGSRVAWKLGTIAPGASSSVSVSLKPVVKGVVKNTVEAKGYCCEAAADSTTKVLGIPAILLEVLDVEDPIEIGANTTYEIVVTNQGSAEGTNIAVVATLPEELEFVSAVGPVSFSENEKTITFAPLAKLPERTKATYRVTVKGKDSGDVRFKISMTSDQSKVPVEETESTHVYK